MKDLWPYFLGGVIGLGLLFFGDFDQGQEITEPAPVAEDDQPVIGADNQEQNQFVLLSGTSFLMGAQATDEAAPGYDAFAGADEAPPRKVMVDDFWIQKREVTAHEYRSCVWNSKCTATPADGPMANADTDSRLGLSMNYVNWEEASKYCEFIGARLPTEAEWEFVARGALSQRFPFGAVAKCPKLFKVENKGGDSCTAFVASFRPMLSTSEFVELEALVKPYSKQQLSQMCDGHNARPADEIELMIRQVLEQKSVEPLFASLDEEFIERKPDNRPLELSLECSLDKPPNPADVTRENSFGVEQLAGGMWEWTADYYSAEYYGEGETLNPKGPTTGERRVQRGGGWMSDSVLDFRGATRASMTEDARLPDLGFRCARSK